MQACCQHAMAMHMQRSHRAPCSHRPALYPHLPHAPRSQGPQHHRYLEDDCRSATRPHQTAAGYAPIPGTSYRLYYEVYSSVPQEQGATADVWVTRVARSALCNVAHARDVCTSAHGVESVDCSADVQILMAAGITRTSCKAWQHTPACATKTANSKRALRAHAGFHTC